MSVSSIPSPWAVRTKCRDWESNRTLTLKSWARKTRAHTWGPPVGEGKKKRYLLTLVKYKLIYTSVIFQQIYIVIKHIRRRIRTQDKTHNSTKVCKRRDTETEKDYLQRNPCCFALFPSSLSIHENKYTARRPCWYGNMTKKIESPVWDVCSLSLAQRRETRREGEGNMCASGSLHLGNIENKNVGLMMLSILSITNTVIQHSSIKLYYI